APQLGHSPPAEIDLRQTGPARSLSRRKAYRTPFLFAAAIRRRPCESVSSVAVVPQSESVVRSFAGSFQLSSGRIVLGSNATTASAYGSSPLPVVRKSRLRAASTTGVVQIVPPVWPSGTTFHAPSIECEARSTRR